MKKNLIIKAYGTDYPELTKQILSHADLETDILETVRKERPEIRIGIKPNLVCPSPARFGATTHPELVEALIQYLQEKGFCQIMILEGSWVGDSTDDAFEYCGYRELAERYDVLLADTKKNGSVRTDCKGIEIRICDLYFSLDYLINVPVLKGHCQTKMTCALKNMKGLIPDSEKRRFHQLGLHEPIAHLNSAIRQDFILVDDICPDPDFEEGGNPQTRNCIFASKDPVLTDILACRELGLDPEEVPYIGLAAGLGVGKTSGAETEVICGKEPEGRERVFRRLLDVQYAVEASDTCSACYASLTDALWKLEQEGMLSLLTEKIGIGQGMKSRTGKLGVGNCTHGFDHCIRGCPPSAEQIYSGLKEYLGG